MKLWVLGIALMFVTLGTAKAAAPAEPFEDATPGYCFCYGSSQFWDLIYVDSSGRKNLIYTYPSQTECFDAKARTPLCGYSADAGEMDTVAAHGRDYCNDMARRCWVSCDGAPYSCYQRCMINAGCRP